MGNTPREKALYASGITLGMALGIFIISILQKYWQSEGTNGTGTDLLTGIIAAGTLVVVSFVWRNRASKLK